MDPVAPTLIYFRPVPLHPDELRLSVRYISQRCGNGPSAQCYLGGESACPEENERKKMNEENKQPAMSKSIAPPKGACPSHASLASLRPQTPPPHFPPHYFCLAPNQFKQACEQRFPLHCQPKHVITRAIGSCSSRSLFRFVFGVLSLPLVAARAVSGSRCWRVSGSFSACCCIVLVWHNRQLACWLPSGRLAPCVRQPWRMAHTYRPRHTVLFRTAHQHTLYSYRRRCRCM